MEPVAIRHEEAIQGVAQEARVVTLSEVDAKIAKIQGCIKTIEEEMVHAKNAYFWRTSGSEERGFIALGHVKSALESGQNAVGEHLELAAEIVETTPTSNLFAKIETLQHFERTRLFSERSFININEMKLAQMQIVLGVLKEQVAKLDLLLKSEDSLTIKIQRLAEVVAEATKITVTYANKELSLELFRMCKLSVESLLVGIPDFEAESREVTELLSEQLSAVKAALVQVEALPENFGFEKLQLWDPNFGAPAPLAELQGMSANAKVFASKENQPFHFLKDISTKTSLAYRLGYYPQTGAHGVLMQQNVGAAIAGLQTRLHEELLQLCRAELSDVEVSSLAKRLDHYLQYFNHIEAQLKELTAACYDKPLDILHEELRKYAHGLRHSLYEVANTLLVVKCFVCPYEQAVLKAQRVLNAYLAPANVSKFADVASFDDAVRLFSVGTSIREIQSLQNNERIVRAQEAATYIANTKTSVEQVFTKQAQHWLALTDEEKLVWDFVIKHRSTDSLYYKNESKALLPKRLLSVLAKWATKSLFVTKTGEVNGRLEVLLYAVKQDKNYQQTCLEVPGFFSVIKEYDDWNLPWRRDRLLEESLEILGEIFEAEEKPKESSLGDILAYTKIMQKCIDFSRGESEEEADYRISHGRQLKNSSKDELELLAQKSNCAKKMKARRQSLSRMLFSRLDSLAKARAYVDIHEMFLKRKLEDRDSEPGEGCTFLTLIESVARPGMDPLTKNEFVSRMLEGLVFRLLVAALNEENRSEKEHAQRHLSNILELNEYQDYRRRGFSEYTKQVLFKNTVNKLAENREIGPNERNEFITGPVAEFMEHTRISFTLNTTQDGLYYLILKEQLLSEADRPLEKLFREKKGDDVFETWFNDYRVFAVSGSKGGISRSSVVGDHEVQAQKECARRVHLYTQMFVKTVVH